MYYVYILFEKETGKIYTGFSADLRERIKDHQANQVHTTARFKSKHLIYYEAFNNQKDAYERERYLKTTQGKRTLKIMLKHTFAPVV